MIYKSKNLRNRFVGTGSISGKVMKSDNKPMVGAKITLLANQSVVGFATTNSLGEYRFSNLDRNYVYNVIAFDPTGEWEGKASTRRLAGGA